jgi:hypothetical protein
MKKISESAVRRLSLYLRFLQEADAAGTDTISSGELARRGGATSAQVRKDLSLFGSFGKRGTGYSVKELLREIRTSWGLNRSWNVALVGAGKLVLRPLLVPRLRGARGFRICAVFGPRTRDKVGRRGAASHRAPPTRRWTACARRGGRHRHLRRAPPTRRRGWWNRVVGAGVRLDPELRPVRRCACPTRVIPAQQWT